MYTVALTLATKSSDPPRTFYEGIREGSSSIQKRACRARKKDKPIITIFQFRLSLLSQKRRKECLLSEWLWGGKLLAVFGPWGSGYCFFGLGQSLRFTG